MLQSNEHANDCANSLQQGGPQGRHLLQAANVKELLSLATGLLPEGTIVQVAGYFEAGDGGAKLMRWVSGSAKADNGGTVHVPSEASDDRTAASGRWEALHNGVADFRWFGIFGSGVNADDAMDTMANDPSIRRIEAHTNLNFIRRHTFHRSNLEFDFHGHTVTTEGIALNTRDNPFGAVIFFQGMEAGVAQTVTLTAELAELTDVLEVADSSAFQEEDWWIARIAHRPEGKAQRELDYLLKVTEIIDATHVRFNYKLGWTIEAGRELTLKKMNPVVRSSVRNMKFIGVPVPPSTSTSVRPFETWDQIGSNPVAYEFAVSCDVSGIEAKHVFWPVIQRRYCTYFVTERCELINPVERDWGGTGYLTQQLNVLYGHIRDCNASNARHLNDFTCAAYCMVENCHSDGDDYGPFVTHGQFEHDLTFVGNSGLLSFANSGTHWGDSAKRITVKKHTACWVVAHKKLTDLTLEDVHVFIKEGNPYSGAIWANADGLQMKGCTAQKTVTLSQSSARSVRRNVLDNCTFGTVNDIEIARQAENQDVGYRPVASEVVMQNCRFHGIEKVSVGSIDRLILINTWFEGASSQAGSLTVKSKEIFMQGGGLQNCCLLLEGAWDQAAAGKPDQSVTVGGGAQFSGTNAEKAFLKSTKPGNAVTWSFGDLTSAASDADTAHFHIAGGGHKLKAIGSRFIGGRYEAAEGGFGEGRYLFIHACIEEGVDRSSLPEESAGVKHSEGNLTI